MGKQSGNGGINNEGKCIWSTVWGGLFIGAWSQRILHSVLSPLPLVLKIPSQQQPPLSSPHHHQSNLFHRCLNLIRTTTYIIFYPTPPKPPPKPLIPHHNHSFPHQKATLSTATTPSPTWKRLFLCDVNFVIQIFLEAARGCCKDQKLQSTPFFIEKVVQTFEMMVVRHGWVL